MPKFETKNVDFGYFWPKMPYLDFCGQEFQKNIVRLEISTFKFVFLQSFSKKIKMPKFGTKNAVFGYFWARILKIYYCHIWNQHPWIFLIAKYCEIMKMAKFGSKNALIGHSFLPKSLIWVFLGKIFRKTIVIF